MIDVRADSDGISFRSCPSEKETYLFPKLEQMNTYQRKYIPRNEVKKHRSKTDLWIIIENNVYDVSGYKDHPGGKDIFLPFAGNYQYCKD